MLRFLEQVVADWRWFIWDCNGEQVNQIEAQLFNGMTLILDPEDFFDIADDEGF